MYIDLLEKTGKWHFHNFSAAPLFNLPHKLLVRAEVKQVWQHSLTNKSRADSKDVSQLIPAVYVVAGAPGVGVGVGVGEGDVCSKHLMDQERNWSHSLIHYSCGPIWLLGSSITTQRSLTHLLSAAEQPSAPCFTMLSVHVCLFVCIHF